MAPESLRERRLDSVIGILGSHPDDSRAVSSLCEGALILQDFKELRGEAEGDRKRDPEKEMTERKERDRK